MSRTTVVYLGGFGRSGSTLVERMLGAAPGWVNVGELVDLARSVAPHDELCGCGSPFSTVPRLDRGRRASPSAAGPTDVLDRLTRLQRAAARQRHLPGLLGPQRRPRPAPSSSLRYGYAPDLPRGRRGDRCHRRRRRVEGPGAGPGARRRPGVDLRMLNLVRDPRAVAWSWNWQVDRPHATSGADEMWRIPAHRSAAQWSALQVEMDGDRARRAGSRRPGCATRTSSPTRSRRWSTATARSAFRSPPPTCRPSATERRARAQPRTVRQPGTVPLRAPSRCGATTAGPPRCPAADRAVVTALTLPAPATYGYPATPATSASRRPAGPRRQSRSTT